MTLAEEMELRAVKAEAEADELAHTAARLQRELDEAESKVAA